MKKIAILTSGHPPIDERIFHKIGMTLVKFGYKVNIICSTLKVNNTIDGILLSGFEGSQLSKTDKRRRFHDYIRDFQPDILLCCEPFTILVANDFRRSLKNKVKIISDITEWYPENVALKLNGIKKVITYIKLFLFNIYTANLADSLIIGEKTKLRRYSIIAPFKKKEIIGYYPRLEFFQYSPPLFDGKLLTLCYAGLITFERGIITLLNAALRVAEENPQLTIRLKIAGKFQYKNEEEIFKAEAENNKCVKIEFVPWVKYQEISANISDADICFDLRQYSFVYKNSLPIKIFEYMACGKPVIYSDIKPIRDEVDVEKFGFLVNPENIGEIVQKISLYIKNKELLIKHSLEARKQAENKFNWRILENKLIRFIEN